MNKYFVKQYGAERTGTNVLRLLLKKRFLNIEVLMHTLGDKHSLPIDYDSLKENLKQLDDPYEEIYWETINRPSLTTDVTDQAQTEYLRTISYELARAILENRLFFFISIKHPYSWIYSFLKHQHMLSGQWAGKNYLYLVKVCKSFNRRYASWMTLLEKFPEKTYFIRFEDLLNNPEDLAIAIRTKFQLQEDNESPFLVHNVVNPTHWDNSDNSVDIESFDKDFYTSHAYYNFLTPQIVEVVNNSIDWALMERYGYHDSIPQCP